MSTEAPADVPEQTPSTPAEPAPAAAEAADKQQTFDADYVAKLRAEAAKYRTEAKANADAAKKLADIEEANKSAEEKQAERMAALQQENEQLRVQALKAQVAAEQGVPVDLLAGNTADELAASAERLLAFRGAAEPAKPAADFGAGDRGEAVAGVKQLSRADIARMSPDQIVAADDAGQFADLKAGRL